MKIEDLQKVAREIVDASENGDYWDVEHDGPEDHIVFLTPKNKKSFVETVVEIIAENLLDG